MPPTVSSNMPNRVLNFSILVMIVSAFIVFVAGYSLSKIHRNNQELEQFLDLTKDIQPNFEQSLELYTENAEDAIGFVQELRPEREEDYVVFIQNVEQLAQELRVKVDLQSLGDEVKKDPSTKENVLEYRVGFYGGFSSLTRFLEGLEDLPYYIRVTSFDYQNLNYIEKNEDREVPNITLILQLYVK